MKNESALSNTYNEIIALMSDYFTTKASKSLIITIKVTMGNYISDSIYGSPDINIEDALVFLIVNDLVTYVSYYKDQKITDSLANKSITSIIRSLERELNLVSLPEEVLELYNLIEKENETIFQDLIKKFSKKEGDLGGIIQSLFPAKTRKKFAANFTYKDVSLFLAQLLSQDKGYRIIDPFTGSGRLLTAILPDLLRKRDKEIAIRGVELFPLSARLAKCQIAVTLTNLHARDQLTKVIITTGDAFQVLKETTSDRSLIEYFKDNNKREKSNKYDLVIMNPPYTRYNLLPGPYREFLSERFVKNSDYFGRHAGLHIYAMFLADELLSSEGRLVSVLPASTLYSKYSEEFKPYLLSKYDLEYIICSATEKAYSEASEFREIIMVGRKKSGNLDQKTPSTTKFLFLKGNFKKTVADNIGTIILDRNSSEENNQYRLNVVSQKKLSQSHNWMQFFLSEATLTLDEKLRDSGIFIPGKELPFRLVRGFEMYGPGFFFFPNKNYEIIQDGKIHLVIKNVNTGELLDIPKSLLVKALRKPGLYNRQISPIIDHWALSIPKDIEIPSDVEKYLLASSSELPAKKQYGQHWFAHIDQQIQSKNPWGHIFIADKTSLASTGVIANYIDDMVTCSKNFYVLSADEPVYEKFLAIWLNSTLFLSRYLVERREIGGTYGRLQIIDFLTKELFPPPDLIKRTDLNTLFSLFDNFRKLELASIIDQTKSRIKYELDQEVLKIVNRSLVDKIRIGSVYESVEASLEFYTQRD